MASNQRDLFDTDPGYQYQSSLFGGGDRMGPDTPQDVPGVFKLPAEFWKGYQQGGGAMSGNVFRHDGGRPVRTGTPPPFEFHDTGLPRILAGRNPLTGNDVRKLFGKGVTHILDLRESHEWEPPRKGDAALVQIKHKGLARLNVAIVDATAPSPAQLTLAVDFIATALQDPQAKVYVHCRAGKGRTGAILMAYAAAHVHQNVGLAHRALQASYRLYQPLYHQEQAVRGWFAANYIGTPDPAAGGKSLPCDGCDAVLQVAECVVSLLCPACYTGLLFPPPGNAPATRQKPQEGAPGGRPGPSAKKAK